MIKRLLSTLLFIVATLLSTTACAPQNDTKDYSPINNFNELWRILDEGYCFFDEKLPPDTTWRMIYDKYKPQIKPDMGSVHLFDVMSKMICELNDGHVNLVSPFDVAACNGWRSGHPENVNNSIRYKYLGRNYRMAGGILYNTISYGNHTQDSIGLMIYSSFSQPITATNILAALTLMPCKGLIIDTRNNGGGNLLNAELFASFFAKEKTLVGYMKYKTGPGHNDFSTNKPIYISPIKGLPPFNKPVVLLTNIGMYSAANSFAMFMKEMPNVTLIGDKTGGGGGLPRSSELPNGWKVRYSASVTSDPSLQSVEHGVTPDITVFMTNEDIQNGKDTLIETAITLIKQHSAQ